MFTGKIQEYPIENNNGTAAILRKKRCISFDDKSFRIKKETEIYQMGTLFFLWGYNRRIIRLLLLSVIDSHVDRIPSLGRWR